MDLNGTLPPDPGLLTTNDLKRLRVALDGRDPQDLLAGDFALMLQVIILALHLREDPGFTLEQAGDVPLGSVFDLSGGPPDPPTATPGARGATPRKNAAPSSKKKPTGSASGPSSAAGTGSPAPSTTS